MRFEKKPIIGVTPIVDYQRESLWMLPGYFEGIRQAGGVPFMLPLTTDVAVIEQLLTMCDGLLITGGQDVAGEHYGCDDKDELALIGETSPELDLMEGLLLKTALEFDIPVLGICRGIQFINAALGGTLWQDLPAQYSSEIDHHGDSDHSKMVHTVEVLKGTPLATCTGAGELAVTSYHHQAVREVAPGLEVMAISEDGLVEAVCYPKARFLWAVQWHPELSYATDEASRLIFEAFVGASVHQTIAGQELIWV